MRHGPRSNPSTGFLGTLRSLWIQSYSGLYIWPHLSSQRIVGWNEWRAPHNFHYVPFMAGAPVWGPEQQIESPEWPSMIVKIAVLFILISGSWEANWNITEHQLAPCVPQDNRTDGFCMERHVVLAWSTHSFTLLLAAFHYNCCCWASQDVVLHVWPLRQLSKVVYGCSFSLHLC